MSGMNIESMLCSTYVLVTSVTGLKTASEQFIYATALDQDQ